MESFVIMQSLSLFALLMGITPAIAGMPPFARFHDARPWKPARETDAAVAVVGDGGLSPVPTEAARHPDFGEMELFKRYQMGSDTCGFASGYKSEPWTCFKVGATCATTGSYLGCCSGLYPACLTAVLTTCIDYTDRASSTSCGPDTLCCASASPSCFTWEFSTSASPGNTYTIFNCYDVGGTGTLVDAPPGLTASTPDSTSGTSTTDLNPSTSTLTTSSGSSTSSAPPSGGGDSSTNVGAIVGGVVGGLAVIGVAAVVIFWLFFRRRRQNEGDTTAAGAAASGQQPPMGSPGLGQQGWYDVQQQGEGQGFPQYGAGVYPPEQKMPGQPGYDPRGSMNMMRMQPQYTGTMEGAWSGTTSGQPVNELGVQHPVGSPAHRAELGG